MQHLGHTKANVESRERGQVDAPLAERRWLVAEHAHLRVVQQRDHPPLNTELRELDGFRDVTLGVQPDTEGVHRAKVGVDRHRTEALFPLLDDEVLQRRLRGQRCGVVRTRRAVALEGNAIPDEGRGRDVLKDSCALSGIGRSAYSECCSCTVSTLCLFGSPSERRSWLLRLDSNQQPSG